MSAATQHPEYAAYTERIDAALAADDRPTWLPAPPEARRDMEAALAEDHADGTGIFDCSRCGCPWPDGDPWCLGCGASNAD